MNVDLIGGGNAQGELAALAVNGKMNPNMMRPFVHTDGKSYITVFKGGDPKKVENYAVQLVNNATLRRDEWKSLDEAVQRISEQRLVGITDLVSAGLIFNLGNAMGTTVLEHHSMGDALSAELSMDGITRGKNDRPEYKTHYLPIPIIHVDYQLNMRVLEASRKLGNPLDTTLAERAARKVSEKLEDMLFTNVDYAFGGGTIYSYINHPDRNKVTLATGWDDSAATPAKIIADVIALKQASINANHYGPWVLYVPTAYDTVLDEDYDTSGTSTQTIRQRIQSISGISKVVVADKLAADNVVLVQMTSDVVRLVRGMGVTNVEWKSEGNMVTNYKVMTIQVPQIRSDADGKSGIVHLA